jgi:glycosyltransferase involved in cell wall biosynthesis
MRVLIVHNRYRSEEPSGENAVVEQERSLLREADHNVTLLEVESDWIAGWSRLQRAKVPPGVVWSRSGARSVRDAVRTSRPDIVHFHNTFPLLSPAAIRAASGERVATAQTFHNFRPICPSSTGLLRDGRTCRDCVGHVPLPAVRHACYRDSSLATLPLAFMDVLHQRMGTWTRHLDRLIFPSEYARDQYLGAGWPRDRMVVKYNTAPRSPSHRTITRSGVLCVARMRAEKGVDLLLDAWRATASNTKEHLILAGGGEQLRSYEAAANGIERVAFVGQRPASEIASLLARALVLVVPSRVPEVFPRVVVEAYAHSTPVIAARRGALQEVVEDGLTGFLFEPENSGDLARVLTRALSDPNRLREMGERARERFESRYAPEATTTRLVEIYEEAVSVRARRAQPPVT